MFLKSDSESLKKQFDQAIIFTCHVFSLKTYTF